MSNTAKPQVDRFFTGTEARYDRWRGLLELARKWEIAATNRQPDDAIRAELIKNFADLRPWEDFYAYPGPSLLNTLNERINSGDAAGTARLARSISAAVVTHSYRTNIGDWEKDEDSTLNLADRFPLAGEQGMPHRPYFEVLVVSPARQSTWRELAQDLRQFRRSARQVRLRDRVRGQF